MIISLDVSNADNNGGQTVEANENGVLTIGKWDGSSQSELFQFQVVSRDNNVAIIALIAPNSGHFVSIGSTDRDGTLRVQSISIGNAEKFQIVSSNDGSWALKSIANGKYVSVDNKVLKANQNSISTMSKFNIINVQTEGLSDIVNDSSGAGGFFSRNKGQN